MKNSHVLELAATPHSDPRVLRASFNLLNPYVEQCRGGGDQPERPGPPAPSAGPVDRAGADRHRGDELVHSLGLNGGEAQHSRLQCTLERTVRFGLAEWGQPGRTLSAYTKVSPRRDTDWTGSPSGRVEPTTGWRANTSTSSPASPTSTAATARLDRLRAPPDSASPRPRSMTRRQPPRRPENAASARSTVVADGRIRRAHTCIGDADPAARRIRHHEGSFCQGAETPGRLTLRLAVATG